MHKPFCHRLAYALIILGLTTTACLPGQRETSKVHHQTGELTRGNFHLQWVKQNIPEYLQGGFERDLGVTPDQVVALDHPLTKHLQNWLDRFHNNALKKYPEALKNTPAPQILLVKNAEFDAYVKRQTQCLKIDITKEGVTKPEKPAKNAFHLALPGEVTEMSLTSRGLPYKCLENLTANDLLTLIELFNRNKTGCTLREEAGALVATKGCFIDDWGGLGHYDSFTHLSWSAESNIVFVTTGTITAARNEGDLVAILAHELGHYYRTHNISFLEKIGFFYQRNLHGSATRPSADPQFAPLAEKLRELHGFPYFNTTEKQTLHTAVMTVGGLDLNDKLYCESDECQRQCTEARDYFTQNINFGLWQSPDHNPTADAASALLTAESKLLACTKTMAFSKEKWQAFKGAVYDASGKRVKFQDAEFSDMKAALLAMHSAVAATEQETKRVLAEAAQFKLGYYTHEQEADEISAELLTDLGLKAELAYGAQLSLMHASEGKTVLGEYSTKQCETFFANNWQDADGNTIDIPVGAWRDAHHSLCYRLFNLSQEFAVHNYTPTASSITLLDDKNWLAMQGEAQALHPATTSEEITNTETFRNRREALTSCAFSRKSRGE